MFFNFIHYLIVTSLGESTMRGVFLDKLEYERSPKIGIES